MEHLADYRLDPPEPKLISVWCGWCKHWVEVLALAELMDWELECCPHCGEAL